MATVKKGILTRAGEWWVHLRPYGKREFWHRERKAATREIIEDPELCWHTSIACYCALSGDVRHVTRETCCEICDSFDRRWRGNDALPPA